MHWLYILQNESSGSYYIGSTNDVKRRLNEHNNKTKNTWASNQQGNWKLILKKEFSKISEARKEEKTIKWQKSRKYIERFIQAENKVIGVVD